MKLALLLLALAASAAALSERAVQTTVRELLATMSNEQKVLSIALSCAALRGR